MCPERTLSAVAEREGFEPPIRLPVCRISSAVRSTTLPPLQALKLCDFSSWPQNEISPLLPNCYHYPLHFSTRPIAVRRAWSTPSAASFRITSTTSRLRLRPRPVG